VIKNKKHNCALIGLEYELRVTGNAGGQNV